MDAAGPGHHPAVVNVGVAWVIRNNPAEMADFDFITYREYVGVSTVLLLFVALTAPDVVCPDRRPAGAAAAALPAADRRRLRGGQGGGAISAIVFGFSFLPQVVLFVGQMLVSDGALEYLTDNAEVLWQVPMAVALFALYY